jgi:hypothetical protein
MSGVLAAGMMMLPAVAAAQGGGVPRKQNPLRGIEVTGSSNAGPLVATLDIERFQVVGDQLLAIGQMSGKVGDKAFNHQAVAFPVTVTKAGPRAR